MGVGDSTDTLSVLTVWEIPPQVCVALCRTRGQSHELQWLQCDRGTALAGLNKHLAQALGVSGFVQVQSRRSPARQPSTNRVPETLRAISAPRTSPFLSGSLTDLELSPGFTCE